MNIIIQCFMGFCGRVTNRSGNRDAGVSTNSPCRDINDTTVSSLLSLSLSRVQRAIFFLFLFFFPPEHRRENWSWLDHDEIAVFRGRERRRLVVGDLSFHRAIV